MSLSGKTVVFTGTLTMKRADATKAAEAAGAKVVGSVSKNTNILVAGPGAGAKEDKARELGVEVWTEDEFTAKIGGGGGGGAASSSGSSKAAGKKKKEPEAAAEKPASKKAKKAEPAPPASPAAVGGSAKPAASPGGRAPGVDRAARDLGAAVFEDYDAKLNQTVTDGPVNSNKFYIIQVLQKGSEFACWNRWGRVGENGQNNLNKLSWGSKDAAIKDFKKKFKDKSLNTWEARLAGKFVKYDGKYQLVEVEDDDGDESSGAVLGKLTRDQIERGQAVLAQIRELLEASAKVPSSLTNTFYSLIPTVTGRKAPPQINGMAILGEKEAQLEFWLRMGFEDMTVSSNNPLEKLATTALPTDLTQAATSICDLGAISTAMARGKTLAGSQAGKPTEPMGDSQYAAIVLYTGNAIYRALNEALRIKHAMVPKYLPYIKLFFNAAQQMPKAPAKLWRGIAADLFDEYEPGKVITWWTVSSTTASEQVARGFMSQLGGKATLLSLDTTSAMNIEPLSIYPQEKESLLVPGTQLEVVSRKRNGKLAEIHVKEVGNALDAMSD